MATLKANGDVLVEMKLERTRTDGAEADAMMLTERRTIRAMTSGYTLERRDVLADYGMGGKVEWHNGAWKRLGHIKAALMTDKAALFNAFQAWADGLRAKGWDAELAQ